MKPTNKSMTMSESNSSPNLSATSEQPSNQTGVSKEFLETMMSNSSGPKMEIRHNKNESSKEIFDSARSVRDMAGIYGYADAFDEVYMSMNLPQRESDRLALVRTNPHESFMIEIVEKNTKGLGLLHSVFQSAEMSMEINKSKTADYLNGLAWVAMKRVEARAIPLPEIAQMLLIAELKQLNVHETEDPQVYEDELLTLK